MYDNICTLENTFSPVFYIKYKISFQIFFILAYTVFN